MLSKDVELTFVFEHIAGAKSLQDNVQLFFRTNFMLKLALERGEKLLHLFANSGEKIYKSLLLFPARQFRVELFEQPSRLDI